MVISALRTLQEKISRLESERIASKDRIQALEKDLAEERSRALASQFKRSEPITRPVSVPLGFSLPEEKIEQVVDQKLEALRSHVHVLERKLEQERNKSPVRPIRTDSVGKL